MLQLGLAGQQRTVFGSLPLGALDSDKSVNTDKFWATGISVIVHPKNPFVPSVHMNLRMLVTNDYWFGGGADITPMLHSKRKSSDPDTLIFHDSMRHACEKYPSVEYEKLKENCDEYFYIKHRNERRGLGGIFFDKLKSEEKEEIAKEQSSGNNVSDEAGRSKSRLLSIGSQRHKTQLMRLLDTVQDNNSNSSKTIIAHLKNKSASFGIFRFKIANWFELLLNPLTSLILLV